MKICIGIISYLPDDIEKRNARIEKLNKLIGNCNVLFRVPILIIAQNWADIKMVNDNNLIIYHYDRLGITGARRELRKRFIESEYDYLVMFDDDSELIGDFDSAQYYLREIEAHPGGWAESKPRLLKLFAISKELYKLVDFPEGGVEDPDLDKQYFEDMWLCLYLDKKYPQKKFRWKQCNLIEKSDSAHDVNSTWWHNQRNKHEIGDITRKMIKEA